MMNAVHRFMFAKQTLHTNEVSASSGSFYYSDRSPHRKIDLCFNILYCRIKYVIIILKKAIREIYKLCYTKIKGDVKNVKKIKLK